MRSRDGRGYAMDGWDDGAIPFGSGMEVQLPRFSLIQPPTFMTNPPLIRTIRPVLNYADVGSLPIASAELGLVECTICG